MRNSGGGTLEERRRRSVGGGRGEEGAYKSEMKKTRKEVWGRRQNKRRRGALFSFLGFHVALSINLHSLQ